MKGILGAKMRTRGITCQEKSAVLFCERGFCCFCFFFRKARATLGRSESRTYAVSDLELRAKCLGAARIRGGQGAERSEQGYSFHT